MAGHDGAGAGGTALWRGPRPAATERAGAGAPGWFRPFDAGCHLRPSGQLPRAREVVVGCDIGRHAHLGEALQHDQRVVRAAAQRLSASEQKHQRRILWWTGLHGPPRQVVKGFVVAAIGRRERQLAAVVPLRAAEVSSWLGARSKRQQPSPAREASSTRDPTIMRAVAPFGPCGWVSTNSTLVPREPASSGPVRGRRFGDGRPFDRVCRQPHGFQMAMQLVDRCGAGQDDVGPWL